jgi:hypothetical protein
MKNVDESIVRKVVDKMYKDSLVTQSGDYFLKLKYTHRHFKSLIPDADVFHSVIGFLPNTNHRGIPFVLSVVFNKKDSEYEITVHNPRLKF